MKLVNPSQPLSQTRDYPVIVYANDGREGVEISRIQAELGMDVFINGILATRMVCTPDNLAELVLGHLRTQGIISSADQVESIVVQENGQAAHVTLAASDAPDASDSSDAHNASDVPGLAAFLETGKPGPLSKVEPIPYEKSWLFNLADTFAADTPMHKKTWGAHSCYLAVGERILYCCEDLGRHNALDKVIGFALRDGVDLAQAIIYSSGRAPVDMVGKAIRAGVPIMMTKAVPTEESIKLARKYALTLICSARPDSMKVFNAPKPKSAQPPQQAQKQPKQPKSEA